MILLDPKRRKRPRMRRVVVLLLFLGVLSEDPLGTQELSGQSVLEEVVHLRFEGNERFSDEILETAIITRETACRSPILLPFCWTGMDFSEDPYYLHPREFTRDLARLRLFYYQRGYRETVLDTATVRPAPGQVEVTFSVQEGDPVRIVEVGFQGDESPDSSVLRDLPAKIGNPLNALILEATRDSLTARLRDQGFAHADVLLNYSIPRDSPLEATVTYDLYTGPSARIGPISVVGNVTVSEAVVRRMLPLTQGRPYSETDLLDGQLNLYNLDIFTFADITPVLDNTPDSIVPVMVRVAEGDVHRVRAGAGFSTADCINTEARWASRNFLGGARRLQVTGRVSKILAPVFEQTFCPEAGTGEYGELNWMLSADFTQPWLRSPRTALNASLIGERESLPDVFIREALSFNIGLTHLLQPATSVTLSYRPEISRLDAAEFFFCSTYLLCTPEDIDVLQGTNWLAPFGLRFSQDRRNQALSPTRGHALILDTEHAANWSGSDFPYTRILTEGSWHTQGRSRWVFGSKLRAGWVVAGGFQGFASSTSNDEIVHPEKRLYAGGSNSVRGYAQNRLGPQVLYMEDVEAVLNAAGSEGMPPCTPQEVMDLTCDASTAPEGEFSPRPSGGSALLEGSVEFRFPVVGQRWEGAAFLDFGQVWDDPQDVNLNDLEFSPGFGIRYFSPIGPIRIDLAYRLDPGDRLNVVTSQIRAYNPAMGDREDERIMVGGVPGDYVISDALALLIPKVDWGKEDPWSLRRLQLHLTIGQAF
jgi:outer membrane protein insertion porin family/translocation and assembly module TamA